MSRTNRLETHHRQWRSLSPKKGGKEEPISSRRGLRFLGGIRGQAEEKKRVWEGRRLAGGEKKRKSHSSKGSPRGGRKLFVQWNRRLKKGGKKKKACMRIKGPAREEIQHRKKSGSPSRCTTPRQKKFYQWEKRVRHSRKGKGIFRGKLKVMGGKGEHVVFLGRKESRFTEQKRGEATSSS